HFIVAKLDEDDPAMNNEAVRARLDSYPCIIQRWGLSKSKIHAINRDLDNLPPWDILVCMSDDMRFTTKGYDDMIRKHMPADLDGLDNVEDDDAKSRVFTMRIPGRTYYQRDGYIYYEGYYSMWCDDEETCKAKIRGKYILVPGIHIEHLHYTNKAKAKKDEL